MIRQEKFLVLKIDDVVAALEDTELVQLEKLCDEVRKYRVLRGKKPNTKYVTVNQDEPYAEIVWKLIETFENLKAGGKLKL